MGKAFLYGNGGDNIDAEQITATTADILEGKKAIIDDSGEVKAGTMKNKTSVLFGSADSTAFENSQIVQSAWNNDVGAFDYRVGGYVDPYVRVHIANLTPNNIKKGVKIGGKNGFIEGAYASSTMDFPLSIQDSQPTPVKSGHIWVKSSTLASKITYMSIQESLWAGTPNNSLQFVVGETAYNYLYMRENKNLTSGGNNILTESRQNSGGSQEWVVCSSASPVIEYKLNRPMVYSTVDGVLDVETAYMWNGSSWVLLCQKGNYLTYNVSSSSINMYNNLGNSLSLHSNISCNSSRGHFNADGTYFCTEKQVLKRTGDVFTTYFTFPTSITITATYYLDITSISADGTTIGALYTRTDYSSSTTKYDYVLVVYKNNGSTFYGLSPVIISTGYVSGGERIIHTNSNGTAIAIKHDNNYNYSRIVVCYVDGDTVSLAHVGAPAVGSYFGSWGLIYYMWIHGDKLYIKGAATANGSTDAGIHEATLNFTAKNVTTNGRKCYISTFNQSYKNHCVSRKDGGLYFIQDNSSNILLYFYNPSLNKIYSTTISKSAYFIYGLAVNLTNDRLAFVYKTSSSSNYYYLMYYALNRDDSSTTLTVQELQSISYYSSIGYSGLSICPN